MCTFFLWIFFLWCFFTRKRQWRKLWRETRSNRDILAKIWKEPGRFSPWDDCLIETVVAAVGLVFNGIEFRQRTKALYSTASKFSVGMFLGLWKEIASSLARMECVVGGKLKPVRLERNCGLNWNLLFWVVIMTNHASSGRSFPYSVPVYLHFQPWDPETMMGVVLKPNICFFELVDPNLQHPFKLRKAYWLSVGELC